MKENIRYSELLPIIQKCLIDPNYESCAVVQAKVFTTPLFLNVLGKTIPAFATDLLHSIQIEFANKNLEQESGRFARNPFNKLVNNYYFIREKQWHPLNCSRRVLDRDHPREEVRESNSKTIPFHAYQPQFYFGDEFADFCVEKAKAKSYFLPCSRINISKWRFRIVNVNRSGWYAPIIEAIDFKLDQQPNKQEFRTISCVIYEDSVRLMMEKLRLQDLRAKKTERLPHEEQQISMLYFLKDAKQVAKRPRNIFKIDNSQSLLFYNKKRSFNYVLFGEADGLLSLTQRMAEAPLCQNRIKLMSMEGLKALFNMPEAQKQKPDEDNPRLWSSSDEEAEEEHGPPISQAMIDEGEESGDEDDPLRKVYMKEFKGLSMKS